MGEHASFHRQERAGRSEGRSDRRAPRRPAGGGRAAGEGGDRMTPVSRHRKRLFGRCQDGLYGGRAGHRAVRPAPGRRIPVIRAAEGGNRGDCGVPLLTIRARMARKSGRWWLCWPRTCPCSSVGQSTRLVSEMSPVRSRPGAPTPPGNPRLPYQPSQCVTDVFALYRQCVERVVQSMAHNFEQALRLMKAALTNCPDKL